MPEPKERGNLEKCASDVFNHIEAIEFVYGPELNLDNFRERMITAVSGQAKVVEKIKAIKDLAEKTSNQELLALLREEFRYGLLINW